MIEWSFLKNCLMQSTSDEQAGTAGDPTNCRIDHPQATDAKPCPRDPGPESGMPGLVLQQSYARE